MSEIIDTPTLEEEEKTIIQKPKRKLNDAQKAAVAINLAKGRANLATKKQQQREEAQIKTNAIVIQKADKLKRISQKKEKQLKYIIGMDDDKTDEETDIEEIEEHIVKKPKKKRIIYRQESDSEEEVIIRKTPKKREPEQKQQPPEQKQQTFRINFC